MVLHTQRCLHGVNSLLEAGEHVGEGIGHVGKEQGAKDEEVE